MGRKDFNRKQCIKSFKKLGFVKRNVRKRGNHDKYIPPEKYLKNKRDDQPPFITVPRSRKIHCQLEILKELWALGGEDLVKEFLKNI